MFIAAVDDQLRTARPVAHGSQQENMLERRSSADQDRRSESSNALMLFLLARSCGSSSEILRLTSQAPRLGNNQNSCQSEQNLIKALKRRTMLVVPDLLRLRGQALDAIKRCAKIETRCLVLGQIPVDARARRSTPPLRLLALRRRSHLLTHEPKTSHRRSNFVRGSSMTSRRGMP